MCFFIRVKRALGGGRVGRGLARLPWKLFTFHSIIHLWSPSIIPLPRLTGGRQTRRETWGGWTLHLQLYLGDALYRGRDPELCPPPGLVVFGEGVQTGSRRPGLTSPLPLFSPLESWRRTARLQAVPTSQTSTQKACQERLVCVVKHSAQKVPDIDIFSHELLFLRVTKKSIP